MKKSTRLLCVVMLSIVILAGAFGMLLNGNYRYLKVAYPLAYTELIAQMSEEYDITPSLIAAIICVESHFDHTAVSRAGAVGLMQLTPETFTWAQVRAGIRDTAPSEALTDPEVNVRYGTFTLRLLYTMFEDETAALAAYNAGQGTVRKWLSDPQYSADGVRLDNIPYAETNAYVKRVKIAQTIYRNLYHLE